MLNQITRVKCSENVLFLISLSLSLPPSLLFFPVYGFN